MDQNEFRRRVHGYPGAVLAEYLTMAYPDHSPLLFDDLERIRVRLEIEALQAEEAELIRRIRTFECIDTDEAMTEFRDVNAEINRNWRRQKLLFDEQNERIFGSERMKRYRRSARKNPEIDNLIRDLRVANREVDQAERTIRLNDRIIEKLDADRDRLIRTAAERDLVG
jgi:hypothetical protein